MKETQESNIVKSGIGTYFNDPFENVTTLSFVTPRGQHSTLTVIITPYTNVTPGVIFTGYVLLYDCILLEVHSNITHFTVRK